MNACSDTHPEHSELSFGIARLANPRVGAEVGKVFRLFHCSMNVLVMRGVPAIALPPYVYRVARSRGWLRSQNCNERPMLTTYFPHIPG
jgi:hypothetical protein